VIQFCAWPRFGLGCSVVVTLRRLGDKAATLAAAGRRELAIMMIMLHLAVILLLGV
jgi:hypothetical protein